VYETLTILTLFTYGAELCTLTENNMNCLMTFERRVMRKIFGPCQERDGWGTRTDHELSNIDNTVGFVEARRLQWWSHLHRLEEYGMVRRIF
jgi:hypothetical protein